MRAIADAAQFVVHDINNLLAVIGSGLRLLECQDDAAYRKAIVGKMQEAITRGALLSRQLLDAARPRPESIDGFVAGGRFAAMAGTLDRALRPDITVRTEIAPDLWDFNADPEELYFALLNLCRNSADAMPRRHDHRRGAERRTFRWRGPGVRRDRRRRRRGGHARGGPLAGLHPVLHDKGRGQRHRPRAPPGPALRRRTRRRGLYRERAGCRHAGAPLPPARARAGLPSSIVGTEIAYTPSPNGGVFHVVNPATAAPTS